jgi:hypothetical protein
MLKDNFLNGILVADFSSSMQNCGFEIIFSGQITLLEGECLWHEQFGLFSLKGYD